MERRIHRYDNIKLLLMILVVAAHLGVPFTSGKPSYGSFKAVFVFISSFHMPMFLLISGMFYRPAVVRKKVLYYLTVGLSLKIVMTLVSFIISGGMVFNLFTTDGIPWFMFVLAIHTMATYLLRDTDRKFWLVFSLLLGCFAGYDRSIGDFLCLSRAIVYYPFFLAGVMLGEKKTWQPPSGAVWKAAGALLLLAWGLLCWKKLDVIYRLRPFFTGRNPFPDNELFRCGALIRLLCYAITALMCFALLVLMPDKRIPFVTRYGSRTIQVYFWSQPLNYLLLISEDAPLYGYVVRLIQSPGGKLLFMSFSIIIVAALSQGIFRYPAAWIRNCLFENRKRS